MKRSEAIAIRNALDSLITKITDIPAEINENIFIIRAWKPDTYSIGDVRVYENIPYKCVQAHDSTNNPDWTPDILSSLWMQYHGTTPETARPWITPLGAHDIYKVGEYVIWTDGEVYQCLMDTNYSPADYAQAWSK